MQNRGPTRTAPNQVAMVKIDPSRLNANHTLPGDVLADLNDAFQFYDKNQEMFISITHFRNILHNFGFHRLSKKEIDEELKKGDPDFLRKQGIDIDAVKFYVGYRWQKSGKEDEARECFKLFDRKDKDQISAGDLKGVLSNYLEFPVTDADIKDFITECGG